MDARTDPSVSVRGFVSTVSVVLLSIAAGGAELSLAIIQSEAAAGSTVQLDATAPTTDMGRGAGESCPRAPWGGVHATHTASTNAIRESGRIVDLVPRLWFPKPALLPLPLPVPVTPQLPLSHLLSLLPSLPPFRVPQAPVGL